MTDTGMNQLRAEVAHWRHAVDELADLNAVAAPAAWEALERYLQHQVRGRLTDVTIALRAEAATVSRMCEAGHSNEAVRVALLRLRARYLRAETLLDFYGDAVNSRTNPGLAQLLRGYDVIAGDSMSAVLTPLGVQSPPALIYVDKGLGAAILRAGIRLWDSAHPSPAAAIKLTRHNLSFPTSLLHETGHQVNALAGINQELKESLHSALAPRSTQLAELWSSWASEIGADVHAFLHAGWAPAFALANVVDGNSRQVFRIRPGDPHPFPWVRVMFNVALCRSWFGSGPWDNIAAAWHDRHPVESAGAVREIAEGSLAAMDQLVDICTKRPMRSLRGAGFGELLDPARVSPASLRALEQQAGATLLTSSYLRRNDSIRILALLSTRSLTDPRRADRHREALKDWVRTVGSDANSGAHGRQAA